MSAKRFGIARSWRGFFTLWLAGDLVGSVEGMVVVEGTLPLRIRTTGLWIEPGSLAQRGGG